MAQVDGKMSSTFSIVNKNVVTKEDEGLWHIQ